MSLLVAVAGAVPFPVLSCIVTVPLIIEEVSAIRRRLDITDERIRSEATKVRMSEAQFKSRISFKDQQIVGSVRLLLLLTTCLGISTTFEIVFKSTFTLAKSVAASGVAYVTSVFLLDRILNRHTSVAIKSAELVTRK